MKTKDFILSLIFPVICFVPMMFLGIASWNFDTSFDRIFGTAYAVIALFPLLSVIFLKAGISRLVKWQGLFTAFTAVEVLTAVAALNLFLSGLLPAAGWVGLIIIPLGLLTANGIVYGRLLAGENKRVLKWFTAFLSTPAVYYFLIILLIGIELSRWDGTINIPG